MENTFKCAACKGVFEKGRSDEESLAEAKANGFPMDELEVVCDDCFKMVMGYNKNINDIIRKSTEYDIGVFNPSVSPLEVIQAYLDKYYPEHGFIVEKNPNNPHEVLLKRAIKHISIEIKV